ncbi:hypothetical protein [Azospirillum sp. sgz301742]
MTKKSTKAPSIAEMNAHAIEKVEWTTAPIAICGADQEPKACMAQVRTYFAVHESFGADEAYTLTHLPTGLVVRRYRSAAALRRLADALVPRFDWSMLTERTAQDLPPDIVDMIHAVASA